MQVQIPTVYLMIEDLVEDTKQGLVGSSNGFGPIVLCRNQMPQSTFALVVDFGFHPDEEEVIGKTSPTSSFFHGVLEGCKFFTPYVVFSNLERPESSKKSLAEQELSFLLSMPGAQQGVWTANRTEEGFSNPILQRGIDSSLISVLLFLRSEQRPLTATDFVQISKKSDALPSLKAPAWAQRLQELERLGVVTSKQEGRSRLYSALFPSFVIESDQGNLV